MRFSIIISTFNSDYKKIILTIKSIIFQDFKNYEIIITDDGSIQNHFNELENFFKKTGFSKYLLIKNERNQGTVKNIIGALEKAKGKYFKGLGPGDLLFNSKTLNTINDYLECSNYNIAFGNMKSYYFNKKNLINFPDFSPPNLKKEYVKPNQNINKKIKNLIVFNDWISGVTLFSRTEYILNYFLKLSKKTNVKYCEDLSVALILLEGGEIGYLNKNIVWYEYGAGVSTDKKNKSKILLEQDHINFKKYLFSTYKNNKYIQKIINREKKIKQNTKKWRKIVEMFFYEPDIILYRINKITNKFKKVNKDEEKGFLNYSSFYNEEGIK